MTSATLDDDVYISPSLRGWYNGLNDAEKEQYRKAFLSSATASSTTSQPSGPDARTDLDQSFTKPSDRAARHSDDAANATAQIDSDVELGELRETPLEEVVNRNSPTEHGTAPLSTNEKAMPQNKPDAPDSSIKQRLIGSTLQDGGRIPKSANPISHGTENKSITGASLSNTSVYSSRDGFTGSAFQDRDRIPKSTNPISHGTENKPITGSSLSNLSVYSSGRRPAHIGTKVPMSLKRDNSGIIANPLVKNPTLPTRSTPGSGTALTPIPEAFALPNWYKELIITSRSNFSRETQARLVQIRDRIAKCVAPGVTPQIREAQFDMIRKDLHVYEYYEVDEIAIKKSKLLEYHSGLPQLFAPGLSNFAYPFDIAADAEALYNKWRRHDFDPDILRGIDHRRRKGKNDKSRLGSSLMPNYPNRISANEFGDNDLVNGQWWPMLLAALRDGAHGAAQAGIHGVVDKGAYSILVSGSHYEDRDEGETLRYCGTEGGDDGELTDATKRLHENIDSKQPVRVLRTSKLPAENPYRPTLGYRYDGLYDVVSFEVLNAPKGHHRFLLRRRENQQPIRCNGVYARPSPQDIEAYENNKDLMK